MKMLFVCIITLASCINACAMNTVNTRKYINENRNNPEALRNLLIEMGRWPVPDLSAAERILKMKIKEASANASDNSIVNGGAAALTTAAANGQTDYVKLLLKYGADINQGCPWNGFTALMKASLRGCYDTAEFLIGKGADVNLQTSSTKNTALILAAGECDLSMVKMLIKHGAVKDLKNEEGQTALDEAKEKRRYVENKRPCDEVISFLSC